MLEKSAPPHSYVVVVTDSFNDPPAADDPHKSDYLKYYDPKSLTTYPDTPDNRDYEHGRRCVSKEHVRPRNHVHARSDHRRRMDQRADGRWPLHRVREPDVQRELRRLSRRAHEEQQARDGQDPELAHGIRRQVLGFREDGAEVQ